MTKAGMDAAEQQAGFIGQYERLNAILEEAHVTAAKIVGPQVTDEEVADEPEGHAGQLEYALDRALLSAQGLAEQLRNIAQRFRG